MTAVINVHTHLLYFNAKPVYENFIVRCIMLCLLWL